MNAPNGVAEENLMPPILESFIPGECLPEVIDADVDYARFYKLARDMCPEAPDLWKRFTARHAIKFVRQYPPRTITDKGTFNSRDGSIRSTTDADY